MTTFFILCGICTGAAAIFLFLHGSPRRRPFARDRISLPPQVLKCAASCLIVLMFALWIAALGLERAIFAGAFFLSFAGGGLLLTHALSLAAARQKHR